MRTFRNLTIWNNLRNLVKEVYTFTQKFSSSKDYGLISQINRYSILIPANITEDCAKSLNKNLGRLLQISLGSLYQLEHRIILCLDLKLSVQTDS
ncbi:four helix bundle protein [Lutibacter sp. A80]|uniref:four helix bundle protein n=1 Tax=Lutibacter sp. A80 TaxID=2918453 RepID=UPI0035300D1C